MATLHATVRYLEKQGIHDAAKKVQALDERPRDVESDPRLSSDPLTALAAVMKEHGFTFGGQNINPSFVPKYVLYRNSRVVFIKSALNGSIKHEDIKPEPSNES